MLSWEKRVDFSDAGKIQVRKIKELYSDLEEEGNPTSSSILGNIRGDPQNKAEEAERSTPLLCLPQWWFSPSYCTHQVQWEHCTNIIPTPPQFRGEKKERVKCLEAAEVYKGTSREVCKCLLGKSKQ